MTAGNPKWQVKKRGGYWRLIPPYQKASIRSCYNFEEAKKYFPSHVARYFE